MTIIVENSIRLEMIADVAVVDHITCVGTVELSDCNWHPTAPFWSTESTPELGTTNVVTVGLPVKLNSNDQSYLHPSWICALNNTSY